MQVISGDRVYPVTFHVVYGEWVSGRMGIHAKEIKDLRQSGFDGNSRVRVLGTVGVIFWNWMLQLE